MSVYTTEVRYICETEAGLKDSVGLNDVESVIEESEDKIFNDYPIFDESYRSVLNKKILMHYYTREICEETVGLWKLRLHSKMNEIMPYYNQLYKSELLEFNPLYDVDLKREHDVVGNTSRVDSEELGQKREENSVNMSSLNSERSNSEENERNASNIENERINRNGTDWDKYSDTPQGAVTGLENDTYLSNARKMTNDEEVNNQSNGVMTEVGGRSGNESSNSAGSQFGNNKANMESTREGNSNINNFEKYVEKVVGKSGGESYAKKLMEFRKSFLNIDLKIIEELSDLFFCLW